MKLYDFVVKSIGQLRTFVDPPYIPVLKDRGFTALFDKISGSLRH